MSGGGGSGRRRPPSYVHSALTGVGAAAVGVYLLGTLRNAIGGGDGDGDSDGVCDGCRDASGAPVDMRARALPLWAHEYAALPGVREYKRRPQRVRLRHGFKGRNFVYQNHTRVHVRYFVRDAAAIRSDSGGGSGGGGGVGGGTVAHVDNLAGSEGGGGGGVGGSEDVGGGGGKGGECVGVAHFSSLVEGPQGVVHGGCLAAVLDDAMVVRAYELERGTTRDQFVTAYLTLTFHAKVPLGSTQRVVVSTVRIEKGRKLFMRAQLVDNNSGALLTTGEQPRAPRL